MSTPWRSLGAALCPWLTPALQRFESARGRGQLGHAWLISGPAGSGKLNLAFVLARRLLGNEASVAALSPDVALAAQGARHAPMDRHPDLHWLYPEEDKQTISVEQVRDVIEALALTAHAGGAKVVIIEPAEALTPAAANALLKTLEEPSGDTYLLLLSHQPGRLPATIRSRCQQVKVARPPAAELATWLGVELPAIATAHAAVGDSPLAIAAVVKHGEMSFFSKLQSDLTSICEDRIDVQTVAHSWAKDRPEAALTWLERRLHAEIRSRYEAVSTEVTVQEAPTLHNALRHLPTRVLFDRHEQAGQLLNLLGSGLNVELALQALLSAFVVNRGKM
jgi:DNA polymerase-3 subunit delta'